MFHQRHRVTLRYTVGILIFNVVRLESQTTEPKITELSSGLPVLSEYSKIVCLCLLRTQQGVLSLAKL